MGGPVRSTIWKRPRTAPCVTLASRSSEALRTTLKRKCNQLTGSPSRVGLSSFRGINPH
ncbi:hypothetical protein [Klebsiella phage KPP-5]|nr:hypothetical protein [Klebsiella phage KPP-5]